MDEVGRDVDPRYPRMNHRVTRRFERVKFRGEERTGDRDQTVKTYLGEWLTLITSIRHRARCTNDQREGQEYFSYHATMLP